MKRGYCEKSVCFEKQIKGHPQKYLEQKSIKMWWIFHEIYFYSFQISTGGRCCPKLKPDNNRTKNSAPVSAIITSSITSWKRIHANYRPLHINRTIFLVLQVDEKKRVHRYKGIPVWSGRGAILCRERALDCEIYTARCWDKKSSWKLKQHSEA